MKVSTTTVGTREVELTVEPDQAFMDKAMQKAARRISQIRPVPGFRPGKAPYDMVVRTFGRRVILEESLREHSQGLFSQAIGEAGIEPYDSHPFEIVSEEPLVLKVRVPQLPLVTLGDYKAMHVDAEPPVTVTDQQVDEEIEASRRRHATYQAVDRPVQMGDQVVADVKGTSDDKDLVVDRKASTMTVGAELTPPGFAEAIVDMKKGETREFTLAYPADYVEERLAGKTVAFTVTLDTVRQVNLPALDDEFAKTVGDFANMDEMRAGVGKRIQQDLETRAKNRERSNALNALVSASTIEYPAAALETEISGVLESRKAQLRQIGFDYAKYLQMVNKTDAQMREDIRPEAVKSLTQQSVLHEFAKAERLTVPAKELDDQIERTAAAYGPRAAEVRERFAQPNARLSLYIDMLQARALEHLTDLLTGRAKPNEESKAAEAAAPAQDEAKTEPATAEPKA